jgi:protein-tyrosine phosphatase
VTSATILVVCTGNVCRSPMAEALLRHHLQAAELALPVSSAGTLGWNSAGPTDHTLAALSERGVTLEGHVSRRITADLIASSALILTMTNDHAEAVRNHHPEASARTFVLGQLVRLGERRGPRGETPLGEWVADVDALREPRRRSLPRDEIADPLGEPLPAYQALAAALDVLTARLARLLTGRSEGDPDTPLSAGVAVSEDRP